MIFHLSFFLFIDIFSKKQSFVSTCIKFVCSIKKIKEENGIILETDLYKSPSRTDLG